MILQQMIRDPAECAPDEHEWKTGIAGYQGRYKFCARCGSEQGDRAPH